MLVRVALVAFAAFSVIAYAGKAEGSHPFQGSGQLNINYLHADFEAFGDGRVTYRLCDEVQRGVPSEWQQGVEKWDSALGASFEFDPITSCSRVANGSTILRWELGEECGAGALACWRTWANPDWYAPHGSHHDIRLGVIIFDPAKWDQVPKWRSYMPVHEFGHDLSLADHVSHNCAENTVMLNYLADYFPPQPCGSDPTIADLTSVTCNVYGGAGGGPWSGWEDLGGMVLNSAPAVAAWDCNRPDV